MSRLALIRMPEYDVAHLEQGLKMAYETLGLTDLFTAGEQILIKPNLLSASGPERAVTPHPAVFEGLIRSLSPFGLSLNYGDSPAVHSPKSAAKASGLAAVAERFQIPLADFTQAVTFDLPDGVRLRQIQLAKGAAEADGLINLCKLKTHALTGMTGAIKNLYGVIVGAKKAQMHVQFPDTFSFTKMLAELNHAIRPRLHLIDAVVGMEGNGPMNGSPRRIGWLIVSTDPVAADTAGAILIGYNPIDLAIITSAEAAGLGTAQADQIETWIIDPKTSTIEPPVYLSELQAKIAISDFVRPHLASSLMTRLTKISGPLLRRYFLARPVIHEADCTRCGQCVRACPVEPKALDQSQSSAVPLYQYERCIRCYCCQETCPHGAITVEPSPLSRAWGRLAYKTGRKD